MELRNKLIMILAPIVPLTQNHVTNGFQLILHNLVTKLNENSIEQQEYLMIVYLLSFASQASQKLLVDAIP